MHATCFGLNLGRLTARQHKKMHGLTRWYSWLRYCTTSWKVAGSISDATIS